MITQNVASKMIVEKTKVEKWGNQPYRLNHVQESNEHGIVFHLSSVQGNVVKMTFYHHVANVSWLHWGRHWWNVTATHYWENSELLQPLQKTIWQYIVRLQVHILRPRSSTIIYPLSIRKAGTRPSNVILFIMEKIVKSFTY